MQMYSNEYDNEYGIHTFEDRTRGLRSRTSVVDVVVRQRRPHGHVVVQPDDECHTCSTSRLYRLAAKKTSPPSSGSAEQRKRAMQITDRSTVQQKCVEATIL